MTSSKFNHIGRQSEHKESQEEDMKLYAEKAMTELLGLYGYGDSTENKTAKKPKKCLKQSRRALHFIPRKHYSRQESIISDDSLQESEEEELNNQNAALNLSSQSNLKIDTSSEDEDNSSPHQVMSNRSEYSIQKSPEERHPPNHLCTWCKKKGSDFFSLQTPSGEKSFCSDNCFARCRRASFKINKICDWCKNVRHTINYVDFQDGEQQLQFCSDQCLSQYKMHIFYKETEAHLHMIPTITSGNQTSQSLITPDLWLKDPGRSSKSIWDVNENDTEVHLANPLTGGLEPASSVAKVSDNLKRKIAKELSEIRNGDSNSYNYPKLKSVKDRSQRHWLKNHKYKKYRKKSIRDHPKDSTQPAKISMAISSTSNSSNGSSSSCESCLALVPSPQDSGSVKNEPPVDDEVVKPDQENTVTNSIYSWLLNSSNIMQAKAPPFLNYASNSIVPPPMLLVPYPVAVPLPIPIPIPLPLVVPLDAASLLNKHKEDSSCPNKKSGDKSVESVISRLWTLSKNCKEQSDLPSENSEENKTT